MPEGYLSDDAVQSFCKLRETSISHPSEEMMEAFPECLARDLVNTWQKTAIRLYQNWIQHILEEKARLLPLWLLVSAPPEQSCR